MSDGGSSFISEYLEYTRDTESPYIYHRWCALSAVGAVLGRNYHLPFGHQRIFPNLYCLFVGEPGTRKSTAIKTICRKLVSGSGYDTFAADKTSKEKFLLDLEGVAEDYLPTSDDPRKGRGLDEKTLENLWDGEAINLTDPREIYIMADEFSEFSGVGNAEFYTTLGNLWDWDEPNKPFTNRLKNSRSVSIYQPTVSLLGGTTPSKFAKIFPVEIMDDGFLSRMILIKGDRSGRKYPEPPEPDAGRTQALIDTLRAIRTSFGPNRAAVRSDDARLILHDIYNSWQDLSDVRFKSYSTRRYTQLLKLCLIVSAAHGTTEIGKEVVIEANTYLSAAELSMPAALGEFGKSKNSDVADRIMQVLEGARKPIRFKELWSEVHKDLDKPQQLIDIINSLEFAGKIQKLSGHEGGILAKKQPKKQQEWVDWSLLTEEERKSVE